MTLAFGQRRPGDQWRVQPVASVGAHQGEVNGAHQRRGPSDAVGDTATPGGEDAEGLHRKGQDRRCQTIKVSSQAMVLKMAMEKMCRRGRARQSSTPRPVQLEPSRRDDRRRRGKPAKVNSHFSAPPYRSSPKLKAPGVHLVLDSSDVSRRPGRAMPSSSAPASSRTTRIRRPSRRSSAGAGGSEQADCARPGRRRERSYLDATHEKYSVDEVVAHDQGPERRVLDDAERVRWCSPISCSRRG